MPSRWKSCLLATPLMPPPPSAGVWSTDPVARRIAANAPLAVQAAKELAIRSRDLDLQSGLRLERMIGRMLQDTEDVAEGSRAFAEKRDPRFKGQ